MLFLDALQLKTTLYGSKHPSYAATLNRIANLYADIGNVAQAQAMYTEALNIRAQSLGKEHPDYAATLNNLAVLFKGMRDYTSAEKLYQRSD